MAGLIDTITGLIFGTGLEFQTPIGGAGLTIQVNTPPPTGSIMITEASDTMITEAGDIMITE